MPASTVESAFVLVDRATGTARGIKRELRGVRVEAERAGDAMDRLTDPKEITELKALARETRGWKTSVGGLRREIRGAVTDLSPYISRTRGATRETDRMRLAVDRLAGSLRSLGLIDARPHVEISGIAQARAELAMLRRELGAFGRQHPTARVHVGSSGGMGGGTISRRPSFGGGGGRGGGGLRAVDLGPFSLRPGAGLAMYAAGLPVGQALLGGAAGVGGTVAGAGLGAGAVGAAGLGVGAVGLGGVVSVLKPAAAGLKELAKQQQAYNDAVADYGRRSLEAARARRELAQAEKAAPAGGAALLRQQRGLGRDWTRLTRPGQSALLGAGAYGLQRVRSRAPMLARSANRVSRATGAQGREFADFATAPAQLALVSQLSREFARDLPHVERTAEHLLTVFGNVSRASLPFLREGIEFVDRWTGGWAKSTSNVREVRRDIGGFVDDFKALAHLSGAGFDVVKDLLSAGRPHGRTLLGDATDQLERWDVWLRRNPARVDQFMRDAADDTERLAAGVGGVVSGLHSLADDLRPLLPMLERFGDATALIGGLGPGALGVGLGAYGALRGRGRGGGGVGGGGNAALGSAAIAGAGGLAWAARGRATYGVGRAMGAGRLAAGAAAAPSLLRGGGGTAARGAASKALPIAAIFALLDAYGFEGGGGQRVQAGAATALSTLTLGASNSLLSRPQSRPQLDTRAQSIVDATMGRLSGGRTPAALQADVDRLRIARQHVGGLDVDLGSGSARQDRLDSIRDAFTDEIRLRRQMARDLEHQREVDLNARSRGHAARLTDSLGRAYGTLSRKYGTERAFDETLDTAFSKQRGMRRVGARALTENVLRWAGDQASKDPRLADDVERFTRRVERSFSKMGETVKIINGRILTGSRAEWRSISRALTDPAELAAQKVSAAFTTIQRQASGSLQLMGYSTGEANALIRAQERGGIAGFRATQTGISATHGDTGANRARKPRTGDALGMTRTEDRGRGAQIARTTGGGSLMGADPALAPYAALGADHGARVTSGLRKGAITSSGNVSLHAGGHAIDMAGGDMMGLAKDLASQYGSGLEELIYSPLGWGIKNGKRVPLSAFGPEVIKDHFDHVHVGDVDPRAGGAPLTAMFSPDTSGPGLQSIRLRGPKSGVRGISGVLADRASAMYAAGLEKKLNAVLGGATGLPGGGGQSDVVAAFRRAIAQTDPSSTAQLALWEAGIVESGLRNLTYGDRDSLGALQERVSIYGRAHATNPFAGAMRFLTGAARLEPWHGSSGALAQALQRSAFPGRYDQVAAQARAYMGDGLGRLLGGTGRLQLARGSSTSGAAVINFSPQITVTSTDRGSLRRELGGMLDDLVDEVYAHIESGPEEDPAGLMD